MALKTYKDGTPFTGVIGRTTEESSPAWPEPPRPPEGAPSRGCILIGRNHHSIGLASITETSTGYPGYNGILPFDRGMISEMLVQQGYNTFCVGKWHLTPPEHTTASGPYDR